MSTPADPNGIPALPEVAICASASPTVRAPSERAFSDNVGPETHHHDTAALQDALRRPPPPERAHYAKRIRQGLARAKNRPLGEALNIQAQARVLDTLFLDLMLENSDSTSDIDLALRTQKLFLNAFQALEKKQNQALKTAKT